VLIGAETHRPEPGNGAAREPSHGVATPVFAAAPEELLGSPVVRSMQRRLARQTRTIRLLVLLLVASVLSGALMSVVAVIRMTSARSEEPSPATEAPAPRATTVGGAPMERDGEAAPAVSEETASSGAPAARDAHGAEGADGVESSGAEATGDPAVGAAGHEADYRHALSLLGRAEDESRPLDERLAGSEEALRVLREIAEQVVAAEQPRDLEAQIQRALDLIERLELEAFFPSGGSRGAPEASDPG
jgi:hypothetical protein